MRKLGSLFLITIVLLNSILVSVSYCAAAEISSAGKVILNAIMWFGYAIALGMVVFIGIKYMLGAADAKANMKSAITSWLIGAFIVFGVSTVIGIVTSVIGGQNTAQDIVNAGKGIGTSVSSSENANKETQETVNNTKANTTNRNGAIITPD